MAATLTLFHPTAECPWAFKSAKVINLLIRFLCAPLPSFLPCVAVCDTTPAAHVTSFIHISSSAASLMDLSSCSCSALSASQIAFRVSIEIATSSNAAPRSLFFELKKFPRYSHVVDFRSLNRWSPLSSAKSAQDTNVFGSIKHFPSSTTC